MQSWFLTMCWFFIRHTRHTHTRAHTQHHICTAYTHIRLNGHSKCAAHAQYIRTELNIPEETNNTIVLLRDCKRTSSISSAHNTFRSYATHVHDIHYNPNAKRLE